MTAQKNIASVLPNVDWSIIRYANCWEDANYLLQQLQLSPGAKILSIASGGDNSLSLLCTDPTMVVAADINATQLYLTALKAKAIEQFSREDCLAFFGFTQSQHRIQQYQNLRKHLDFATRSYFDHHQDLIKDGVIHAGKLGKFFRMFAKYILPLIHSKRTIDELFATKSEIEQKAFFKNTWNSKRWRSFFKIAFSRQVLGKYGRDPEFFKQVKIPVADFILQQTQEHLQTTNCQQNPFLQYVLKGKFGNVLPHYMQPENFQIIKSRIDRLRLWQGPVESAIARFGKFNAFNLSNIFEYLDEGACQKIAEQLVAGAHPDAKLAYWNLMVDRELINLNSKLRSRPLCQVDKTSTGDHGFFYKRFVLNTLK